MLPLLRWQLYSLRSVHRQAFAEPLEVLRQLPVLYRCRGSAFLRPRLNKEAPSLGPTKLSKRQKEASLGLHHRSPVPERHALAPKAGAGAAWQGAKASGKYGASSRSNRSLQQLYCSETL